MPASSGARSSHLVLSGLLCAITLAAAPPAPAAAGWLRGIFAAHLGAAHKAPVVSRYAVDSGGEFTLDSSTAEPLLKFQDRFEVFALSPSRGPRGDTIYWNDVGQPLLRATRLGGMTVFTPRRPEGAAASLAGPGAPLRISTIGVASLYSRLIQAAARSTRAAGHTIAFDAPNADPGSDGLTADAAFVASEAIVLMASRPGGRLGLAKLLRVRIEPGKEVEAQYRDGMLRIIIDPRAGYAGRPSSLRIARLVGAR
ncbi:MAG TPA: DUF4908 domain-containing protein [Caulobacteraceae bacterium]|jgi:hypothetical protein|nr:DUF4908 domain-containing protein [Caulobacteraceae bacterium]